VEWYRRGTLLVARGLVYHVLLPGKLQRSSGGRGGRGSRYPAEPFRAPTDDEHGTVCTEHRLAHHPRRRGGTPRVVVAHPVTHTMSVCSHPSPGNILQHMSSAVSKT